MTDGAPLRTTSTAPVPSIAPGEVAPSEPPHPQTAPPDSVTVVGDEAGPALETDENENDPVDRSPTVDTVPNGELATPAEEERASARPVEEERASARPAEVEGAGDRQAVEEAARTAPDVGERPAAPAPPPTVPPSSVATGRSAEPLAPAPRTASGAVPSRRRGVLVVALLAVAVPLAVPAVRGGTLAAGSDAWAGIRRAVTTSFEAVRPLHARATSSAPGHDSAQAWDGLDHTYWAEGAEGDGIGQTITFVFAGKVDVDRLVITPGASDSAETFATHPRPKDLHIVFDNGTSLDVTLKDVMGDQAFPVRQGMGVSRVDVTISTVYRSPHGDDTAITEVEFLTET